MTTLLPRPVFASRDAYAARLADADYWSPYVAEALRRHGLPPATPTVGTPGSSPTFLVGQYVVKLFPEWFDGAICFQSDRAVLRLLRDHPEILAPELVADGALYGESPASAETTPSGPEWPWPYLITRRVDGVPWHEAAPTSEQARGVARQLGGMVNRLHALPPPSGPLWERDWLAEYRAASLERQRQFGRLPPHLLQQIPNYLSEPRPVSVRRLLHADLHDHHLFVAGSRLTGIIDWGDAIVADPYHELIALHLHTFNADTILLSTFLDAYGWPTDPEFERRAMSAALAFPFDALDRLSRAIDLRQFATLDALAAHIWRVH